MKTNLFKKLLGMLLVMTMAVGVMSSNIAFADNDNGAESYTIVIKNAPTDQDGNYTQTYAAFKIFDLETSTDESDNTTYTYTISSDSPWFDVIYSYYGVASHDLTLTETTAESEDENYAKTYVVTVGSGFSAAAFSKTMLTYLANGTVAVDADATTTTTTNELTVDEKGYYLITSLNEDNEVDENSISIIISTSTFDESDSTDVYIKNTDVTLDKKQKINEADEYGDGYMSVGIGDIVNYKIDATVDVDSARTNANYNYWISDTTSDGLTFNENSLSVKIILSYTSDDGIVEKTVYVSNGSGDIVIEGLSNYVKTDLGQNSTDFTETFNLYEIIKLIDEYIESGDNTDEIPGSYDLNIEITYNATVNENASGTVSVNNAVVHYTTSDGNETETGDRTKVYCYEIVVDKIDGSNSEKLEGAGFILYYVDNEGTTWYYEGTEDDTKYGTIETEKSTEETTESTNEDAVARYTSDKSRAAVLYTDEDGYLAFKGLALENTYYLEEVVAPAGYNFVDGVYTIIPNEGTITKLSQGALLTDDDLTRTMTVKNFSGGLLPETGGRGTKLLYAIGAVLVVAAGLLLITRRAMKKYED